MEVDHIDMDCSVSVPSVVATSTEGKVEAHCKKEKEHKEKDAKTEVLGSVVSSGMKRGNLNVTTSIRQENFKEKDTKDVSITLKESLEIGRAHV